jgi:hypothetical protein
VPASWQATQQLGVRMCLKRWDEAGLDSGDLLTEAVMTGTSAATTAPKTLFSQQRGGQLRGV